MAAFSLSIYLALFGALLMNTASLSSVVFRVPVFNTVNELLRSRSAKFRLPELQEYSHDPWADAEVSCYQLPDEEQQDICLHSLHMLYIFVEGLNLYLSLDGGISRIAIEHSSSEPSPVWQDFPAALGDMLGPALEKLWQNLSKQFPQDFFNKGWTERARLRLVEPQSLSRLGRAVCQCLSLVSQAAFNLIPLEDESLALSEANKENQSKMEETLNAYYWKAMGYHVSALKALLDKALTWVNQVSNEDRQRRGTVVLRPCQDPMDIVYWQEEILNIQRTLLDAKRRIPATSIWLITRAGYRSSVLFDYLSAVKQVVLDNDALDDPECILPYCRSFILDFVSYMHDTVQKVVENPDLETAVFSTKVIQTGPLDVFLQIPPNEIFAGILFAMAKEIFIPADKYYVRKLSPYLCVEMAEDAVDRKDSQKLEQSRMCLEALLIPLKKPS